MKLNNLVSKNSKSRKRLGRGIGSTKGKTSGRGHKGQKSRSGVAIKSFEGGQMPLYRRLPKRGFKKINKDRKKIACINLSSLQEILEKKIILSSNILDLPSLQKVKKIGKKYKKLKLLGSGDLKIKFDVKVDFISNVAKEKIEKMGGKVSLIGK
tara:strand:- start:3712 stop:4173 length:462 start_codon:yes stop_codon:yes gene_type:complete